MLRRLAGEWLRGLAQTLAARLGRSRPAATRVRKYPGRASPRRPAPKGAPRGGGAPPEPSPRELAARRLRTVVARDRLGVAPDFFTGLRHDLLDAAQRYADIDERRAEISLEEADGILSVRAILPVLRMRRPPPGGTRARAGGDARTGPALAGTPPRTA